MKLACPLPFVTPLPVALVFGPLVKLKVTLTPESGVLPDPVAVAVTVYCVPMFAVPVSGARPSPVNTDRFVSWKLVVSEFIEAATL